MMVEHRQLVSQQLLSAICDRIKKRKRVVS
jgi:hypothetical protein